MVVGLITAAIPLLANAATVLYTFYAPLKAHWSFYTGLTLVVVGSWIEGSASTSPWPPGGKSTGDGLRYTTEEPVDLAALRGNVVLVFFGYTACPDACPLTMSTLARTVAGLGPEQRNRTKVLLVTVDSAHDDNLTLERWVTAFDPSFQGVRGSDEATNRAASLYGVCYDTGTDGASVDGAGASTVNHTTSLIGIGPDGVLPVVWPPNVSEPALAGDLADLLG
jgi:protein SCO1